jgi:hypothetical protein
MSVVTPSATAAQYIASLSIGQQRFDLTEQSDSNGHTATRLLAPPRWRLAMSTLDALEPAVAALWKAISVQLRGRVNHLAMWDVTLPAPRGTARGAMLTSGTTLAGATEVTIAGTTHKNLLAYPSALDNGVWSKSSTTITADAVSAPDGTMSADTAVVTTSSSGGVFQNYAATPGLVYTFSFWALRSASTAASYRVYDNTNAANIVTASYYSSINGSTWTRVQVTFTAPAGCVSFRCYPCADGGVATPHGASIWGCQLEVGALTDYAAAATLLAGDWLQIGSGVGTSHYCMVTSDATANGSGVITVGFEPPTRIQFAGSTAVTWDKPMAYYRQNPDSLSWSGASGSADVGGFAFDLLESWR